MNDSSRVSGGQRRCEGTSSSNVIELELKRVCIILKLETCIIFVLLHSNMGMNCGQFTETNN